LIYHPFRKRGFLLFIFFVILCSWPNSILAETEIQSRFFTTTDGVRLHYLEAGVGQSLVFVPGWAMPAEIWELQIKYFSKSYHVVAFDPRSQGESEVAKDGYVVERRTQDIKELIDVLGEKPVVLVGWSLGVLESLAFVRFFGESDVRALVLVDNSIGEDPPPVSDPTFLDRLKKDRVSTMERLVRGMYRTPQSEEYYQKIISKSLRTPLEASIALLRYPYPREFWKTTVYKFHKPILYVVNHRFKEQALNLKKNKPGVRVEIFEEAGHALFVDRAGDFNRLLEDFLKHKVLN